MAVGSLGFALVAMTVLYIGLARQFNRPWMYQIGFVALFGHYVVALFVIPILPYQWDILYFHQTAVTLLSNEISTASMTVTAFASVQAILYATFGQDPRVVSIFNSAIAVLIAFPTATLARRLYPTLEPDGEKMVFLTVLFLPLSFLYLTIPMRDTLTVLLLFTVLTLLTFVFDGDYRYAVVVPPVIGMVYLLRPELALVVFVGIAAASAIFLLNTVAREPVTLQSSLGGLAVGTLVGVVLLPRRFSISGLRTRVQLRARGGATYLEGVTYDGWLDVFLSAPVRALYFQFAPFPLHVETLFHGLAALPLPLLILLAIAGLRSLLARESDDTVLVLLGTVYLAGVIGYGLIDSNFGTTVRHRIPFVFLLVVFAAPVLGRWSRSLRRLIGVSELPRHHGDYDGKERETEELNSDLQIRSQHL